MQNLIQGGMADCGCDLSQVVSPSRLRVQAVSRRLIRTETVRKPTAGDGYAMSVARQC